MSRWLLSSWTKDIMSSWKIMHLVFTCAIFPLLPMQQNSYSWGPFKQMVRKPYMFALLQGMSDLLSPILFVMEDESEAFWCFVSLMERLGPNFNRDQNGMHSQLFALSKVYLLFYFSLTSCIHTSNCWFLMTTLFYICPALHFSSVAFS